MKGFHIHKHNSYIENVQKNSEELSLIAKGDSAEIMIQKIRSNKVFCIKPGEDTEIMEFFYILEGSVEYHDGDKTTKLKKGDYYYVNHLKEILYFKSLEELVLLYVSTQPVFHYLSDRIKELTRIVKRIAEKDAYTHDHSRRVKDYSFKISNRMQISRNRIEFLGYSSLFHDIGKIYVPTEILMKPDSLTPDEMKFIKKHPIDGSNMVLGTFLKAAGKIIEQHHERFDGSGYPYGLKGGDILLEARIIAVADSYDAMISDRPYRKGIKPADAIYELGELSGKLYDPQIVKTFKEVLSEDGII